MLVYARDSCQVVAKSRDRIVTRRNNTNVSQFNYPRKRQDTSLANRGAMLCNRSDFRLSRRKWLQSSFLGGVGCLSLRMAGWPIAYAAESTEPDKLAVAAVVTEFRRNTHADVIVGKILEGYNHDGGPGPGLKLASLYVDQFPDGDLSRHLSAKHGFPIYDSIESAVTLGGDRVAVSGVLSIGEHGVYDADPSTSQVMYPRRRFFDGIADTFRKHGQVVPVFNDKHLSYSWENAIHMAETAKALSIPFMAGSSLPVAWRTPSITVPLDCEIEESLAVGYGPVEAYGFHALEMSQCLVERRQGGEAGVSAVRAVQGDEILRTEQAGQTKQAGKWSSELLEAALGVIPNVPSGGWRKNLNDTAAFFLIEHRDGLRTTVAMANGAAAEFAIALKLKGQAGPIAIWFRLQDGVPFGHFEYLLRAIESLFRAGRPPYPLERTLLTTGVLNAAMRSLAENHARIETPHLAIEYAASDWPFAEGVPGPTRP